MRWQIEPIPTWPYKITKYPKANPFRAKWADTLQLLENELDRVDVTGAVAIQIVGDPVDVRRDGMLRANAQLRYRGVALSFTSRHGPLTYPCDTYTGQYSGDPPDWQINVRAIALGLQALRAVDRYGIAGHGEQYRGWRAIEATPSTGFASADEAIQWLRELTDEHSAGLVVGQLLRKAAARAHPDRNGGDRALWDRVDAAKQLLQGGAP